MKIACFSSAGTKFMDDLIEHWRSKGHEVDFEPGANPALAEKADLTYIDFLDNNFYCLWNGLAGDHEAVGWQPYPKKRVAVRAIDIDIWMGRHRDERIWPYMDDMIVINEFYREMVQREGNPPKGKLHLIRPGVNLETFSFRNKPQNDRKIAMVTGNMWEAKATFEAIRMLGVLRNKTGEDYTLHIRGQFIPPEWHRVAHDHLLKTLGLEDKVFVDGPQGSMSDWYQDKDYILVTSYKEAFSYAAAEGMAVGLKPVINNFFGAEDIWPKEYLYSNWDDALEMLAYGEIESDKYRAVIEDRYPLERMLKEYDELFDT